MNLETNDRSSDPMQQQRVPLLSTHDLEAGGGHNLPEQGEDTPRVNNSSNRGSRTSKTLTSSLLPCFGECSAANTRQDYEDHASNNDRSRAQSIVETVVSHFEESVVKTADSFNSMVYLVVGYITIGVVAYSFVFEGWDILDSIYFVEVTLTTVGYGDYYPVTIGGKIFTGFYAFSGIALVSIFLGKLGQRIIDQQVEEAKQAEKMLEQRALLALNDGGEGAADLAYLISNRYKNKAASTFGFLFTIGKYIAVTTILVEVTKYCGDYGEDKSWSTIDSLYFIVITMTTVGYGDYSGGSSLVSKIFCIIFVPLAVGICGTVLGEIAMYFAKKESDSARQNMLKNGLTAEDLDKMDLDGDGKVTKLEFMQFMLMSMQKVEKELFTTLEQEFDMLDNDNSGYLDEEDFVEIKEKMKRQSHAFNNLA